jgi:predicted nucleotidyltransferase
VLHNNCPPENLGLNFYCFCAKVNLKVGDVMLDKSTVIDTVKRYADAVKNEFAPGAIVLFGSYISGEPHEDSDIDVGIVFNGFTGDWLQTSSRLWGLIENISFDIEPILLDSTEDKSGFVKHLFKTGQIIYQA